MELDLNAQSLLRIFGLSLAFGAIVGDGKREYSGSIDMSLTLF
jgi:hypothetical protein